MMQRTDKATLYVMGAFGLGHVQVEVRDVYYGVLRDNEHATGVFADFIEKRQRKRKKIIENRRPSLVILEGWGHPDFETHIMEKRDGGVTVYRSRYASCDPRWDTDFDNFLKQYLEESQAIILADFRNLIIKDHIFTESSPTEVNSIADNISPSSGQLYGGVFVSSEEVTSDTPLREGNVKQILVNAYERNPEARRRCIAHYGPNCVVCGFNFHEVYGEAGAGIIHVHHLKPLSEIGQEYEIDPIEDLRPVCPNCHTIIHRKNPPYTVTEIKDMLRK